MKKLLSLFVISLACCAGPIPVYNDPGAEFGRCLPNAGLVDPIKTLRGYRCPKCGQLYLVSRYSSSNGEAIQAIQSAKAAAENCIKVHEVE